MDKSDFCEIKCKIYMDFFYIFDDVTASDAQSHQQLIHPLWV